eukprot:TRINITY_DN3382_c3_g1_i1.p1 TRINITY_DN3382_c3_g1~~TRINITY_DN3382_c3_g1_i1.p1  ORF type:complete len:561 (+),score=200.69 TRINITY_DN3382_c3_g1_i1:16-1698(+)
MFLFKKDAYSQLVDATMSQIADFLKERFTFAQGVLIGRFVTFQLKVVNGEYGLCLKKIIIQDHDTKQVFDSQYQERLKDARSYIAKKYLEFCIQNNLPIQPPKNINLKKLLEAVPIVLMNDDSKNSNTASTSPPIPSPKPTPKSTQDPKNEPNIQISSSTQKNQNSNFIDPFPSSDNFAKEEKKQLEMIQINDNLSTMGWTIRGIINEGTNLFNAINQQINQLIPAQALRKIFVNWIKQNSKEYLTQNDSNNLSAFLIKISQDNFLGDEITIQCFSDIFNFEIWVVNSQANDFIRTFQPREQFKKQLAPLKTAYLAHVADTFLGIDIGQSSLTSSFCSSELLVSSCFVLEDRTFESEKWYDKIFSNNENGMLLQLDADTADSIPLLAIEQKSAKIETNGNYYRLIEFQYPKQNRPNNRSYSILQRFKPSIQKKNINMNFIDFNIDVAIITAQETVIVTWNLVFIQKNQIFCGPLALASSAFEGGKTQVNRWSTIRQNNLTTSSFTPLSISTQPENKLFHPNFADSDFEFGILLTFVNYDNSNHSNKIQIGYSNMVIYINN